MGSPHFLCVAVHCDVGKIVAASRQTPRQYRYRMLRKARCRSTRCGDDSSTPAPGDVRRFRRRQSDGDGRFQARARSQSHHRGDIFGVYVAPAARATGLSRKLLEALPDHVRTFSRGGGRQSLRAHHQRCGARAASATGLQRHRHRQARFVADGAYHAEQRLTPDLDADRRRAGDVALPWARSSARRRRARDNG